MMTMSKSQEREERSKLGRGMVLSLFGLIFCWVPVLGQLLTTVGFIQVIARFTQAHRVRQVVYSMISFVFVGASVGALMLTLWMYGQNPDFIIEYRDEIWARVMAQQPEDMHDDDSDSDFIIEGDEFVPDAFSGMLGGGLNIQIDGEEFDDWDDDMGGVSEEGYMPFGGVMDMDDSMDIYNDMDTDVIINDDSHIDDEVVFGETDEDDEFDFDDSDFDDFGDTIVVP